MGKVGLFFLFSLLAACSSVSGEVTVTPSPTQAVSATPTGVGGKLVLVDFFAVN